MGLPPRLSPVRIQSFVTTPEPKTTQAPASRFSTPGGAKFNTANRFGFGSNRFKPTQAPTTTTTTTTTQPPTSTGLPSPVKAAPGPNGEEYYYYYYYYDDEEGM